MTRPLSDRERKLVAVGLLLAALALVNALVVQPLIGGFTARAEERRLLVATFERNARLIASIGRLRRDAERQRATAARVALPAASIDMAREKLKDMLAAAVERSGGELASSDEAQSPAGWAAARIDAETTLPQMLILLQQMQNGSPPVVVQSLAVDASSALTPGPATPLNIRVEAIVPVLTPGT